MKKNEITSAQTKSRCSSGWTAAKETGKGFPSSGAAAAEQTGNEFPSYGGVSAKQTGSEFPSSGGVSAKQTGWLQAFTLAEVLISLTIIGVIAAITVPALIQRTNKQEYVTALQKAYSTLSQAANMIIAEEGSPKCTDENSNDGWAYSMDNVYELFKKHLNNVKECDSGSGCWHTSIKYMDGSTSSNWDDNSRYLKLITADGMLVFFDRDYYYKTCRSSSYGCTKIIVDVNGRKKPNIAGRDIFMFGLFSDGIKPVGYNNSLCLGAANNNWYCAGKVLREGAMNY